VALAPQLKRLGYLALIAGGIALLVAFEAPLCPFAALTHQPCPACGMTRATLALLMLDPARAFALHPLVFAAAPLFGVATFLGATSFVREGEVALPRRFARFFGPAMVLLMLVMIAVWVARFRGAFGGPVSV
jgi:hypothetical protein